MTLNHRLRLLLIGSSAIALLVGCSTERMPSAPSPQSVQPSTAAGSPPSPTTGSPPSAALASARYRVTFQATWNAATHPLDFPATAHFSALVGGTHNASARFWSEGNLASLGIKDMAERGRTSPLDQEISTAVSSGTAGSVFVGGGIAVSPGSTALEFEIRQTHPLVTLVSMIAPSPDWFVGVSALPLFENGRWLDERRIELVPWDAGTDSGSTFDSPDVVSVPPQVVSRILATPLSPGGLVTPLGTFTFTRVQP